MFRLLLIAALIFIVVRFVQRHLSASKQQQPPPRMRPAPPEPPLPRPAPTVDYSHARDADFREVHPEGHEQRPQE